MLDLGLFIAAEIEMVGFARECINDRRLRVRCIFSPLVSEKIID